MNLTLKSIFKIRTLQRIWYYATVGHSRYFAWLYAFGIFSIVVYDYFKSIPFFLQLFPKLWFFVTVFLLFYVPLIVFAGLQHRRKQLGVETGISVVENPFLHKATPGKEKLMLWQSYYATRMNLKTARAWVDFLKSQGVKIDVKEEMDVLSDLKEKIKHLAEGGVLERR